MAESVECKSQVVGAPVDATEGRTRRQATEFGGICFLESIFGLFKSLNIRAQFSPACSTSFFTFSEKILRILHPGGREEGVV